MRSCTKLSAERSAKGDPRPSITERYGTRTGYVQQVEAASRRLQTEGFLLDEDVLRFVERAQREPRVAHLAPQAGALRCFLGLGETPRSAFLAEGAGFEPAEGC